MNLILSFASMIISNFFIPVCKKQCLNCTAYEQCSLCSAGYRVKLAPVECESKTFIILYFIQVGWPSYGKV